MYILKDEMKEKIKELTNRYIADVTGLSETYISQVLNQKTQISKTAAFAIAKTINNDYEIEDVFNKEP